MAVAPQPVPVATARIRLSQVQLLQPHPGAIGSSSSSQLGQLSKLEDRVQLSRAKKIGSGNLGVVLLVTDRSCAGRQLAVKVISMKPGSDAAADHAQAWREVQVMREVDHPNAVRLVDVLSCCNRLPHVTSEPPYLCIAMEYVADSDPLSNLLRRSGPSPSLAMQVLPQLGSALAQMHSHGLVHRDVWSENVLVDGKGRAVLVDLGCAEFVSSAAAVSSKLNIPYMSPEAARGQQQSTMDDCWALGLLLTEMVTGKFVADRLGRSDVPIHFRGKVLAQAIAETSAHGGPELASICAKLLEPKAGQRLSMQDVLTWCGSRAGRAASMVPPAVSVASHAPPVKTAASFAPPPSANKQAASLVREVTNGGSARFGMGQPVLYRPRSQSQLHTATVLGTSVGGGVKIRLENGSLKEVDENESWRLTATSVAKQPPSTVPHGPQAPKAQPSRGINQSMKALSFILDSSTANAASPPVATNTSISVSASLKAGVLVPQRPKAAKTGGLVAAPAAAPPAPVLTQTSPMATAVMAQPSPPPPAPVLSQSPKRAVQSSGYVAAGSMVAAPQQVGNGIVVAPKPVPTGTAGRKPPVLGVGQRVMYTARSNGSRWSGRITGRLGAYSSGWRVSLDCGEVKEVPDSDAWRMTLLA